MKWSDNPCPEKNTRGHSGCSTCDFYGKRMIRGVCENCASYTAVMAISDETITKEITAGLRFCSKQCQVSYKNKVLTFIKVKK